MDLPGCFLYSATLACIMYGFSSITSSLAAKNSLPLGILLLICFLRRETRTEDPLIRLDMFRKNIVFSFSNIAALLNYGASYAVSYLLSIYLQTVMGFDSQIAGLILITSPVFQTILSPVAGRLSDRYSPFLLSSVGMGISAAGIFTFIFIGKIFRYLCFSPRWWLSVSASLSFPRRIPTRLWPVWIKRLRCGVFRHRHQPLHRPHAEHGRRNRSHGGNRRKHHPELRVGGCDHLRHAGFFYRIYTAEYLSHFLLVQKKVTKTGSHRRLFFQSQAAFRRKG